MIRFVAALLLLVSLDFALAQAQEVKIEQRFGDAIARTVYEGCRVSVSYTSKWKTLGYRNDCPTRLERKIALFGELLDALARSGEPLGEATSLFLGRLVDYPEAALAAALAARGRGEWRKKGAQAENREFAALLDDNARLAAFRPGLRRHGLEVGKTSVEKVLIGKPDETPLTSPLRAQAVGEDEYLPFDAQVWLQLAPTDG